MLNDAGIPDLGAEGFRQGSRRARKNFFAGLFGESALAAAASAAHRHRGRPGPGQSAPVISITGGRTAACPPTMGPLQSAAASDSMPQRDDARSQAPPLVDQSNPRLPKFSGRRMRHEVGRTRLGFDPPARREAGKTSSCASKATKIETLHFHGAADARNRQSGTEIGIKKERSRQGDSQVCA